MILGYHAIFSCYGFWLPNDPRGSWSDWIRKWEIFRYGPATKTSSRRSVAKRTHNHHERFNTKYALKYPPVKLTGLQARAVSRGFATAIEEAGYHLTACAIMPDHVHLVVLRDGRPIEQIVRHLKGRATRRLNAEHLTTASPSPWAKKTGWVVYLNTPQDVRRAMRYVDDNPVREGFKPQRWRFVTAFDEYAIDDARNTCRKRRR